MRMKMMRISIFRICNRVLLRNHNMPRLGKKMTMMKMKMKTKTVRMEASKLKELMIPRNLLTFRLEPKFRNSFSILRGIIPVQ